MIVHLTDRVWVYQRGQWDGRPLVLGSDEYGRRTVVLRLPGHRALVWAYRTCHCAGCVLAREQTLGEEHS